ncbi:hypothetical protein Tco_1427331 [Tanacetum coccineum]
MEISTVIEEQDPTWMTPIVEFISKGTLPHEQKDARRIRRTAQRFELRDGVSIDVVPSPWLRGVGPIQADLCAPRDSCWVYHRSLHKKEKTKYCDTRPRPELPTSVRDFSSLSSFPEGLYLSDDTARSLHWDSIRTGEVAQHQFTHKIAYPSPPSS